MKIKIVSLNTSSVTGTVKKPVSEVKINAQGIVNDAHAGDWHRQISLLGIESYRKMEAKKAGTKLDMGVFAENITTEGILLHETNIMDRFVGDEVELEVTQIGKKCHNGCEIMKLIGECVMPVEGIFTRVINGGTLKEGDTLIYQPRVIKVMVITLSDRAYKGVYEDKSGPLTAQLMGEFFDKYRRKYSIENIVIPDEKAPLEKALATAQQENYDLVVTTGGTGLGKRDITPDVVRDHLDKEIPGIMEHIRLKYGSKKPNALVSRSIAGLMDETLVYVIPGSVKAVNEYMAEILPTVEHSLRMIHGVDMH